MAHDGGWEAGGNRAAVRGWRQRRGERRGWRGEAERSAAPGAVGPRPVGCAGVAEGGSCVERCTGQALCEGCFLAAVQQAFPPLS